MMTYGQYRSSTNQLDEEFSGGAALGVKNKINQDGPFSPLLIHMMDEAGGDMMDECIILHYSSFIFSLFKTYFL